MICWTSGQNVARGRRPRATFCLKVQHIICCPNPQSIIVLLYLHWFIIIIIIMLYLKKVTQLAQGYSSLRPSLKNIYKNGNNMRNACQKQYIYKHMHI